MSVTRGGWAFLFLGAIAALAALPASASVPRVVLAEDFTASW